MKAVFSAAQLGHSPSRFLSKGNIVAYPDSPERVRMLLDGARQGGASIHAARRFDDTIYRGVHLDPYLGFLRTAFDRWREIEGAGPEMMPSLRPQVPPGFESGHVVADAGKFMMDFSCPITAQTWRAAEASAQTAVTAADLVLKGEPVAYALCRPPGHHAHRHRAGGFCYLNNTALAAQRLRGTHGKVAVLDIDVHHGNGTQNIFYQRRDILTVSIHADPANFYPYYWGSAGETGDGAGAGCNLNLPLAVGSGDDAWLAALATAFEKIASFAPGALIVALGLDAHEADPLKGGNVTQAGFARIAAGIAGLNLPTVLVQEGGYLTEHLSDNLAVFLSAFEGALEAPVHDGSEEVQSES